MSNPLKALLITGVIVLVLALASEDFRQAFRESYRESLQSSADQSYPHLKQQCPPGTALAVGSDAGPGDCAPISAKAPGYSSDTRSAQHTQNRQVPAGQPRKQSSTDDDS